MDVAQSVARILASRRDLAARLDAITATPLLEARLDVRRQLAGLVFRGVVLATGVERLADVERYLRATGHRLDRLAKDPARDADWMSRVRPLEARLDRLIDAGVRGPAIDEARGMLQELRVGLFAQTVGTPYRVSEERARRVLDELEG
jgi:ATP-dependent helicase HrpA